MPLEPRLEAAMDCRELERSIDAYLDGEFDDRERAEAEAHLAGCPRCHAAAHAQGKLRFALRAKLHEAMAAPAAAGRAPAHLRARVTESLALRRRPLWLRLLTPVPLATMAACAAGAMVVLSTHAGNDALIEDAIRNHHRDLPLEFTTAAMGEGAIPAWFRDKLDFHATPPHFTANGVTVVGGRLSNVRELPAAYIRYQLPRGRAGLFIVDDPGRHFDAVGRAVRLGPQVVRVVNAAGYNVAVWRQDEIVYSLVSDLEEGDLFELVQTAQAEARR
jgi:anti-sigma factor RsiW